MKTFCEALSHWLHHPINTDLICENRLKFSSGCRRCKGEENPRFKKEASLTKPPTPLLHLIGLNVEREIWIKAVREVGDEYDIRPDRRRDELSARRIAILLGEKYITNFRGSSNVVIFVPIVEKDCYDLAIEYHLRCDPLECELKVKPKFKRQALLTWGVDKTSGMEKYTTQLKEWTEEVLLEPTIGKEGMYGAEIGTDEFRESVDLGIGTFEDFMFEEVGIG